MATIPDAEMPLSMTDAFLAESIELGSLVEIELVLLSEVTDSMELVTPVVFDLSVNHRCPALLR